MSVLTSAPRERESEYGAGALIVCDNVVRIYQVDKIEVQALQGLDLLVKDTGVVATRLDEQAGWRRWLAPSLDEQSNLAGHLPVPR